MSKRTCEMPDCNRAHYGHGLCGMHYQQARKSGRIVIAEPLTDVERFMTKVSIADNGCWIWNKVVTPNGYGQFRLGKGMMLAHRAAYQLFIGPIPDGLEIDHLCHSNDLSCSGGTSCPHRLHVNPFHCLEPVTRKQNIQRGRQGWYKMALTHCPHGHPYDDVNTILDRSGHRHCRTCTKDRGAAFYQAKKRARLDVTPQ